MTRYVKSEDVVHTAEINAHEDQWGNKVIDISTLKQMCNKDLPYIDLNIKGDNK